MSTVKNDIITAIIQTIDIPESAYDTAEKRYQDIAKWFARNESYCSAFEPHISPQGSFRLGTVVRPLDESDEYDLDLGCQLERGITKQTHTQLDLKTLVGRDIESYRVARRIEEEKEQKNRCWRLHYADQMKFHIDIVPCIPETALRRVALREAMLRAGVSEALARAIANLSVSITDLRRPDYRTLSDDWPISNMEGYARWFESRMKLAARLLEKRAFDARAATIDELPTYRWKTPLQRSVQFLKRHRDQMFADNPDGQPISIIITTLAALAYRGEADIYESLRRILGEMENYVRPTQPRVPNPVNPAEDFADKWHTAEGRRLRLEDNFQAWLSQAKADFELISTANDADFLAEQVQAKFGSRISPDELRDKLSLPFPNISVPTKTIPIVETPARPWQR